MEFITDGFMRLANFARAKLSFPNPTLLVENGLHVVKTAIFAKDGLPTEGAAYNFAMTITNPSNTELYMCSPTGRRIGVIPAYCGMGINNKNVRAVDSHALKDVCITISWVDASGYSLVTDPNAHQQMNTFIAKGTDLVQWGGIYIRDLDMILAVPGMKQQIRMCSETYDDSDTRGETVKLSKITTSVIDEIMFQNIRSALTVRNEPGYFARASILFPPSWGSVAGAVMVIKKQYDAAIPLIAEGCQGERAQYGAYAKWTYKEWDPMAGSVRVVSDTVDVDRWIRDKNDHSAFTADDHGDVMLFKSYDDMFRYRDYERSQCSESVQITELQKELVALKATTIPKEQAESYVNDRVREIRELSEGYKEQVEILQTEIEVLRKENKKALARLKELNSGKSAEILADATEIGIRNKQLEAENERLRIQLQRSEFEHKRNMAGVDHGLGFGRIFVDIGKLLAGIAATVFSVVKLI